MGDVLNIHAIWIWSSNFLVSGNSSAHLVLHWNTFGKWDLKKSLETRFPLSSCLWINMHNRKRRCNTFWCIYIFNAQRQRIQWRECLATLEGLATFNKVTQIGAKNRTRFPKINISSKKDVEGNVGWKLAGKTVLIFSLNYRHCALQSLPQQSPWRAHKIKFPLLTNRSQTALVFSRLIMLVMSG